MEHKKHGTVYEIPLIKAVGGYGYIRVLFNDVLYNKPIGHFNVGEKIIQFLNFRSEEAIKKTDKIDIDKLDLLVEPFNFFGRIPSRGPDKWKKIGQIPFIENLDYDPSFNASIYVHGEDIQKEHRIRINRINNSYISFPSNRVKHLPDDKFMSHEQIVDTINHLWALELGVKEEILHSELGCDSIGLNIFDGAAWVLSQYYHPIFKKIPKKYRGKPLPEGLSVSDFL